MYRSLSTIHLALVLFFLIGVLVAVRQTRGSGSPSTLRSQRSGAYEDVVDEPRRGSNGEPSAAEKQKQELAQEVADMQKEDQMKESVPSILRRPIQLPRQTMNNITSGLYWAYGSWGRVVATSSACWAYPTVDSFSVECKRKLLPPVVLIRLEFVSTLDIVRSLCVSCSSRQRAQRRQVMDDASFEDLAADSDPTRTNKTTDAGGIVRVISVTDAKHQPPIKEDDGENQRVSADESSTFRIRDGRIVPTVATRTASIAIDSQESCKRAGTFPGMCIIDIDVLFRVRSEKESPSEKEEESAAQKRGRLSRGPPPPEVCFITLGDWGGDSPEKRWTAAMLAKVVQRRMVKFIISTGDNFYPTGVQSVNDRHFLDTFERPYSNVALQRIRWYIIAGNHDQWGLPPQKEYAVDHPRWFFPHFHYNRTIPLFRDVRKSSRETIELAVLNTAGREVWQQCDMLDAFFASVEDRHGGYLHDMSRHWRMVANHEPLFSGGLHGVSNRNKGLRDQFLPYMQQSLVHAYFNGDDHFLEVHRAGGTDYFVSGGGGGSARYFVVEEMPKTAKFQLKASTRETITGFMMHCVKGGAMITSLIDGQTGEVVFSYKTNYVVSLKEFGLEGR